MKKELKNEVGSVRMYEIYKTSAGLYIKEDICNEYNIGSKEDIKEIKGNKCLRVSEQEIDFIEKESTNQNSKLIPIYISVFDLQLTLSFNVYIDRSHNNTLYISRSLCKKYAIQTNSRRIFNGTIHCQVTEDDIKKIEEITKSDRVSLKRKYIEIELGKTKAEFLFIYYRDLKTSKSYVTRKILELAKSINIEIEGTPKIIDNKNCYSITDEQIKEIEAKSTYKGIAKLVKENYEVVIPYDDSISTIVEDIMPYNDYISTITEDVMPYDDYISTIIEDIIPYDDAISTIVEDVIPYDDFISTIVEEPIPYDDSISTVVEYAMPYDDYISTITEEPIPYNDSVSTIAEEPIPYNDSISTIVEQPIPYDDFISAITENIMPYDDSVSTIVEEPIPYNESISTITEDISVYDNVTITDIDNIIPQNDIEELIPYDDSISTIVEEPIPYDDTVSTIVEEPIPFNDAVSTIIEEPIPYDESVSTIVEEPIPFDDAVSTIVEEPIPYNESISTIIEDVIPYDDAISTIVENKAEIVIPYDETISTVVENPIPYDESISVIPEIETVIAYRDRRTNKLYIPQQYALHLDRPVKIIMNRECCETTMHDLERIYNRKIIIVDVFPHSKETYNVIVCNNQGKFFVPERTIKDLNISIGLQHRIKVNKEIYVEITSSDLDLIKSKETKHLEINIELKHITPTKKRN